MNFLSNSHQVICSRSDDLTEWPVTLALYEEKSSLGPMDSLKTCCELLRASCDQLMYLIEGGPTRL